MPETKVILVCGSRSGCGKTRLMESLLKCSENATAVKARVREGAALEVTEESTEPSNAQKDTARYLAAGARRAYLVDGPLDAVTEAIRALISAADCPTVLVESNALAASLEHDLCFFVEASGDQKPSAERSRLQADFCVLPAMDEGRQEGKGDELRKQMLAAATDGRIACADAMRMADRLALSRSRVGRIANEEGLRICSCQLGCF